ncbi:MAG: hypothetical protein RL230_433 [Pseudomonadota bacterium]
MTEIPPVLVSGMFWLALLVALVGSAWWVLRAGARGGALESDRADLQVYQDQIAEVGRGGAKALVCRVIQPIIWLLTLPIQSLSSALALATLLVCMGALL